MMLGGLFGMMLVFIGFALLLMWGAKRIGRPGLAVWIGYIGAAYFALTALDTLRFCGALPFIEMGAHVCEGAGRELSLVYALIAAPAAAIFLVAFALRLRESRRYGGPR
ncbi:hypothetical protein [Wenxinia saemankumensis]|uniref:Uncharacterized protein n=1 Tax=Wenxinia saemankumensis TaxID=1447782 RepID=A0A1M6EAP9_9RHOB|nr:hypothetical protein [Wenxinia saemankumensis]SHI82535.1 hypothetical protein SAMN05444417_1905 [Wenxinia saemankumensis]